MKKLYKLFVFVVLLGFTFNVFAAPTSNIFRTLLPETDSTYNIGSNLVRWANGYFDNLDTATITISASSAGNITIKKADPCLIYDVTTATDTDFWTGVTEDAGGDDDDLFQIGDGTTCGANPFLTINTSGNVGIGTTAPLALADFRKNVDTSTTWWTDAVSGLNVQNDHATGDAILKLKGITTGIGRIVYGVASATDKLIFSSRESAGTTAESVTFDNNGNVGIGTTGPNQLLTVENSMSLKEIASANADTAAYGQIWVKTATPNQLWFTDDAGTDVQLGVTLTHASSHAVGGSDAVFPADPGADKYLKFNNTSNLIEWADAGSSGATTALSNLASVAINTTLLSDTDNTDSLGTTAIAWSDLFLGNGSVITWNSAPSTPDLTLTHSAETLTFAGGTIALGTATATGGLTGNVTGNVSGTSATVTGAAQAAITTAVNLPWTGMKPGTDGEIPTFDASGNPAFVAVGTATHVLTSNGPSAPPTFQAPGGGAVTATTVSISSANILGMFATPVEVLAAPGAGKIRIIDEVVFSFTVGTQYANGGNVRLQYDGDTVNILNNTFATGNVTGASSVWEQMSSNFVSTTAAVSTNKAIKITNATAAFITGTGTLKLFILYRDITL